MANSGSVFPRERDTEVSKSDETYYLLSVVIDFEKQLHKPGSALMN